jgi:hypothetical protein
MRRWHLKAVLANIQDLNLPEVTALVIEYVTWLELINPATAEVAKTAVAEGLKIEPVAWARLALSMAAQIRIRTVANPGDDHFSSAIASRMRTSSFS